MKIKKAIEFYRLYKEWCLLIDKTLEEKLNN